MKDNSKIQPNAKIWNNDGTPNQKIVKLDLNKMQHVYEQFKKRVKYINKEPLDGSKLTNADIDKFIFKYFWTSKYDIFSNLKDTFLFKSVFKGGEKDENRSRLFFAVQRDKDAKKQPTYILKTILPQTKKQLEGKYSIPIKL